MKKRPFLLVSLILVALTAEARSDLFNRKTIDLTHALEKGIPQFSENEGRPEHVGTHVDAPRHFFSNKRSVDKLELGELEGAAFVVDVVEQARRNPDYELTLRDLRKWELANGPVLRESIVILKTGWETKWFRPRDFLNKDHNGIPHFPGFSCEVVEYLARNRSVKALGTDTLSIDPGNSTYFCAHKILLGADKYAIEGLTNLEMLPTWGAMILVAPLKISTGSGAPARVIAWLP